MGIPTSDRLSRLHILLTTRLDPTLLALLSRLLRCPTVCSAVLCSARPASFFTRAGGGDDNDDNNVGG